MDNKFKILIYYLIITFLLGSPPPLKTYEITKEMHSKLIGGEIIVEEIQSTKGLGKHYNAYILINKNVDSVFNIISKFEEYPNFMPHVSNIDIVPDIDIPNYWYFIELPMSIKYQYQISSLEYKSENISWLTWKLEDWEKNNIKDTWGQWVISPYLNTKNLTLVQYQIYTDIGYIPFGFKWIVDFLTEYSLPDVLLNTKKYIESND